MEIWDRWAPCKCDKVCKSKSGLTRHANKNIYKEIASQKNEEFQVTDKLTNALLFKSLTKIKSENLYPETLQKEAENLLSKLSGTENLTCEVS